MTMHTDNSPFLHWTEHKPDALLLRSGRHSFRYASCRKAVQQYVAALEKLPLEPGDLLGVALPPSPQYIYLLLAALHLRIVVFPLNPKFPRVYLEERLAAAGCEHCVTDLELEGIHRIPHSLFKKEPGLAALSAELPAENAATLVLTSGSSGQPKAAQHSLGNHRHNARLSNRNIALNSGDTWLLSLPLFHIAGLGIFFRCLEDGATIALPKEDEALEDAILANGVTHVSLVAAQLQRMLYSESGMAALNKLKAILLGGGPPPTTLLKRCHDLGLPLFTTYGMTEMATQITTTRPGAALEDLQTSGWPLDAGSVHIGEGNVIALSSECLFMGYRNTDGLTLPLNGEGRFESGDLGRVDDAGRLHVLGRQDNMFISGGENVQPEAIAQCLQELDDIEFALVVPIPHDEWGHVPAALICANEMNTDAWTAHVEQQLPRFCRPHHWIPWPEKMDSNGDIKIKREEMIAYVQDWIAEQG